MKTVQVYYNGVLLKGTPSTEHLPGTLGFYLSRVSQRRWETALVLVLVFLRVKLGCRKLHSKNGWSLMLQ